jgi:hypothetical protein
MLGRHKHRMQPAGVSWISASPLALVLAPQQTVILFRCEDVQGPDCITSKVVAGKWDLHDVAAIPASWPAEITRDDLPPVDPGAST